MTKCEPRRDHCSTPLLAVLAMALIGIAWSTPANAKLKVELSDEVQQTIRERKESPRAWTKRFDSEWNRGLEELGKTDPDAKTLFESEQTIRIVCFGSQEAKDAGLEPDTTGLYGGVAQMRGDFGADGKRRAAARRSSQSSATRSRTWA